MADVLTAPTTASAAPSATPTAPSPVTTTSSASASPQTVTPAPATSAPPTPTTPGPIPFADHDRVVKRAHADRDALRKQLEQVRQQYEGNPWQTFQGHFNRFASDPNYEPHLLRAAAQLLNARRGSQAPTVPEPKPDIPVQDAQGQHVGYARSAQNQAEWDQWQWAQRESKLLSRLKPLEERAEQAEQHQRATAYATDVLGELRKDPRFVAREADVAKALAEHPEWGDNIHRAYASVLSEAIPGIETAAEGKVLDHLKTQAQGATVAPGTPVGSQRPKFQSTEEAMEYFDKHPSEATSWASR